ncbi:MAG: hypothetical protein D6706_19005 [Chloroflexi bacterium]|nr:MAG: hypothetical protein D6706_19005 [Chloroflexota bacterium]
MHILVFCPLAPTTPMIFGRTVESIFRLEYDGPLHYRFHKGDNPYTGGNRPAYDNIAHNFNLAREAMLRGGYDALLTIEADMIVPRDAASRLARCLEEGADIAYGLYVWRHGNRKWSAYTSIDGIGGLSLSSDPERARAVWGQVVEVAGVGLGCTLISRRVLKSFPFHVADDRCSCDWWLAVDAARAGMRQVCDTGVVCGHITLSPALQVLWPDVREERLYRVDYLAGPPPENVIQREDGKVEIIVDRMGDTPVPKGV